MIHHIAVAKLDVHVHGAPQPDKPGVCSRRKGKKSKVFFYCVYQKYKSETCLFSHTQKRN